MKKLLTILLSFIVMYSHAQHHLYFSAGTGIGSGKTYGIQNSDYVGGQWNTYDYNKITNNTIYGNVGYEYDHYTSILTFTTITKSDVVFITLNGGYKINIPYVTITPYMGISKYLRNKQQRDEHWWWSKGIQVSTIPYNDWNGFIDLNHTGRFITGNIGIRFYLINQ